MAGWVGVVDPGWQAAEGVGEQGAAFARDDAGGVGGRGRLGGRRRTGGRGRRPGVSR